ncbi:unnamed protein product, partial [Staurois parvus]
MKSPILGPGFGNGQQTDCSGVQDNLQESGSGFWASPPADRSQEGSTPADRSQEGFTKERWKP